MHRFLLEALWGRGYLQFLAQEPIFILKARHPSPAAPTIPAPFPFCVKFPLSHYYKDLVDKVRQAHPDHPEPFPITFAMAAVTLFCYINQPSQVPGYKLVIFGGLFSSPDAFSRWVHLAQVKSLTQDPTEFELESDKIPAVEWEVIPANLTNPVQREGATEPLKRG